MDAQIEAQIEAQIAESLQMAQECLTLAFIAETGLPLSDIEVVSRSLPDTVGFAIYLKRKLA